MLGVGACGAIPPPEVCDFWELRLLCSPPGIEEGVIYSDALMPWLSWSLALLRDCPPFGGHSCVFGVIYFGEFEL